MQYVHAICHLVDLSFEVLDKNDNFFVGISRRAPFKFCVLDAMCMHTEMFLFISRLKVMYKQRSSQSSDLDQGKGVTSFTSLQRHHEFMSRIEYRCTTPTLLDYSFLSNIIEVGDVIENQMRADAGQISNQQCVTRATVTIYVWTNAAGQRQY